MIIQWQVEREKEKDARAMEDYKASEAFPDEITKASRGHLTLDFLAIETWS